MFLLIRYLIALNVCMKVCSAFHHGVIMNKGSKKAIRTRLTLSIDTNNVVNYDLDTTTTYIAIELLHKSVMSLSSPILITANIIVLTFNILSLKERKKYDESIQKEEHSDNSPIPSSKDTSKDNITTSDEETKNNKEEETEKVKKDERTDVLAVTPIGYISSLYRLCIGTPRQGLLSPSSRGKINIDTTRLSSTCLIELEKFSHIWLLFQFHANTNQQAMTNNSSTTNISGNKKFPSLIRPPALKGKKVGLFATRTPHRPNPIGLTLCKVDKVDVKKSCIYVSAIDLISDTPILDIKPYVPYYDSVSDVNSVSLPDWVSSGLSKRRNVSFTATAVQELEHCISSMELYTSKEIDVVQSCISDILSVDIRSVYQTKKQTQNKFRADEILNPTSTSSSVTAVSHDKMRETTLCTQQIDNLLVHFHVIENQIEVRHVEVFKLN